MQAFRRKPATSALWVQVGARIHPGRAGLRAQWKQAISHAPGLAPAHFASAKAEIRPSRMVEEIRGLPTLDAGAKARMFMSLSPQADGLPTLVNLTPFTKP